MIRIGTAGWKYKDWDGIVYPRPKPRGFDELEFMARYFSVVEINSSFYGAPRASAAAKWVASVAGNAEFRFTAKLFHSFTHERRPAPADERDFKAGVAPLMEAGRLGALLLQFPWSFRNTEANRTYLIALQRRFREYPLVLEVRHSSWAEPAVLELLGELELGLCNIDQPLFARSIRPGAEVTSSVGYIRLHGRNYKNWFSETADVRERYDYFYSLEELEPWAERAREVAAKARETFIIANNHNLGKAPMNALQLTFLLSGELVPDPEDLFRHR